MDRQRQTEREEQDIARLLRIAGKREELPTTLQQRWETQFRAELNNVLDRRRQRRRRFILGVCASAASAVLALGILLQRPAPAPLQIQVSQLRGEHALRQPDGSATPLRPQQQLAPDSVVETGADGHVALTYGHYDLRLNRATQVALQADRIRLLAGEIYVSGQPDRPGPGALRIDTVHGVIRDIGTQFLVTVLAQRTVTTVRRGALLISSGTAELRAAAQPGSAQRVVIEPQGHLLETQTTPSGPDWRWIYDSSPGFTLEGRSAYDFLQWSVTESGLRLEFATQSAEIHARTTVLHGDIARLDPEQAVDPVLAATDLSARRTADNRLLVSLADRS
ncbi:MAG: FecR domain-containing protein [Halioglobus sp.]|nr:FecR domain-containing protein [Halioglobus sp.]